MLSARLLAAGIAVATVLGAVGAAVSATADDSTSDNRLTVSWLPQSEPAEITPGETSTSRFWVTNTSPEPITVDVRPAIAVPSDNGQLQVAPGSDPRFSAISFSPDRFTLVPNQTVQVTTTIHAPKDIAPGAYLLPAVVEPDDPPGDGNVQIRRAIVALNTFQMPGAIDTNISATLAVVPADGSLVRNFPGLPPVVVGASGGLMLNVRSDSSAGILAYWEAVVTTKGLGGVEFVDHTEGAPDDIRGDPQLYFPGTSRDFPLTWAATAVAAGAVTIDATVSYNPDPLRVESVAATVSFIVVAAWWFVVVAALAVLSLVRSGLRSRQAIRAGRARASTRGARARRRTVRLPSAAAAVVGTVVLALLGAAAGVLSDPLLLSSVVAAGAAFVVATAVLLARHAVVGARLAGWFHLVALVLGVAAVGLVIAAIVLGWPSVWGVSAAAGASTWAIAGIWIARAAVRAVTRLGGADDSPLAAPSELV